MWASGSTKHGQMVRTHFTEHDRMPDTICPVTIKRKMTGGIVVTKGTGVNLTKIDEKMIQTILKGYKMHNVDVLIREDISVDEFIDVVLGNRKYTPCLYVYNKIDSISMEEVDRLAHQPNSIVISAEMDLNLDGLVATIWDHLGLVRIYTKKRGEHPDLADPLVVREGATVEHVCHAVHRAIAEKFKYALVYGKSSKFPQEQKVGLTHHVAVRLHTLSVDPANTYPCPA